MASRKKYNDFVETDPVTKQSLQGIHGVTRQYVGVTCPHCNVVFVELPVESLASNKASKCKTHLKSCVAAKEAGVEVDPPVDKSMALALVAKSDSAVVTSSNDSSDLQEQINAMAAEIRLLKQKTQTYDAVLLAVLPSLQPPLHENTGVLQLKEAIKVDMIIPSTATSTWPPEATRAVQELAAMKHKLEQDAIIHRDRDAQLRESVRENKWLLKFLHQHSQESGFAHMALNSHANKFGDSRVTKRVRFE